VSVSIAQRLQEVQRKIDQACDAAGRAPSEVTLVAVSKTRPAQMILTAATAGQVHFGENYAQELRDKAKEFEEATHSISWHYIGRLQKNKAKYVAPNAYRVHTLEHVDQVHALLKRAPQGIDGLIAINVGRESQKSGVLPEDVRSTAQEFAKVSGCRIHGLMCIPPATPSPEDTAPYFEEMQYLLQSGKNAGHPWEELSMGMSADFHVAVRYGATWVRVGTAIFGPRTP